MFGLGQGLNPFRSGQCLSTLESLQRRIRKCSLNPFRSGQCLSTKRQSSRLNHETVSQSLSIRAMSFDLLLLAD